MLIKQNINIKMQKVFLGFALCMFEYHAEVKKSVIALHFKDRSKGTCFAISNTGLAIATYHCFSKDEATTKKGAFIKIVASDENNDLALLQLPAHEKYSFLRFSDSNVLIPGEEVYHYGYALNSLIGNKGFFQSKDDKFLYASTEMMHGQSGGPVLNAKGEVIGICKGHFYCTPEKFKQFPFHSGPSVYIPINRVKEFILQYCNNIDGEWVLKSE